MSRKNKLTREELRLLSNPPTESSWYCRECGITSPGTASSCWSCGGKRKKTISPIEVYRGAQRKQEASGT